MNNIESSYSAVGTYKVSLGWRLFMLIAGLLLTVLFVYLGIISLTSFYQNTFANLFMLIISISMNVLFIGGIISAFVYRITIHKDCIVQRKVFSEIEVSFSDIYGFRVIANRGILLYTKNKKKKIEVSIYMESKHELTNWVFKNFKSIDVEEIQNETNEILEDVKDDYQKEEIIVKYNNATKIVKVLSILSIVTALWAVIFPRPYELAIVTNMLMPFIAIVLILKYKGIVNFDERRNSIRPSVGIIVILPSMAIALRALLDHNIIYSKSFWIVWISTSMLFITIFFALMFWSNEHKRHKAIIILLPFFLIIYSYGVMLHTNCIYDKSTPEIFEVEVLDKRISSGDNTFYYLKISSWENLETESEISVSKNLYDSVSIGNGLYMIKKVGNLKINWYFSIKK